MGLSIAIAQYNFCVGDLEGNTEKIIQLARKAKSEKGADLTVFPELAITGYPPEDLILRPGFHARVSKCLKRITSSLESETIILGYPELIGDKVFNSAGVIGKSRWITSYQKQELPNYAVFDEKRYFSAGTKPVVFRLGDLNIGLSVCEDIWIADQAKKCADAGADMICNINASPFHRGKHNERIEAVRESVAASGLPIIYTNLCGGQDELIFDGRSFALDSCGELTAQAPAYTEGIYTIKIKTSGNTPIPVGDIVNEKDETKLVYDAIKLGIKDYIEKNNFHGCVIGLSGGIDSALTLALAVDALGPERVTAISMPSEYTADISISDAERQAKTMGCEFHIIPINEAVETLSNIVDKLIPNLKTSVAIENMQSRIRGLILMARSNSSKSIVLATGNKSEMAVGYATLYGDMAGGFAPLKDIPKTMVYNLSIFRNKTSEVIPKRVITRAPTAELAPDQKDTDSLPPYDILDPILEKYIEKDLTPSQIADSKSDLPTVEKIALLVDKNEYKRRQAAPGVGITKRAFRRDRRFPITSKYSEVSQN